MRLFILALTLLLAAPATATAQMMTPDSENGRYSSYPIADGVLRLDTRTGQMSRWPADCRYRECRVRL